MIAPAPELHTFDTPGEGQRSALDQVALAATAAQFTDEGNDMLVLALRPGHDRRKVIASPGNSAIRAAISVAVAAGNTRAWNGTDGDGIVDVPVASLPEIIRSSVEPCGIHSVHVGAVHDGDTIACYSMWLSTSAFPETGVRERHLQVLAQLRAALEHDRLIAAESAKVEAARAAARAAETGDRTAHRAEAEIDALAGLPDREQFDLIVSELQVDEAGVLVIGIDEPTAIVEAYGADGIDLARRTVAGRLAASVRKHDVVAYVADDTFAIILVNVDRHTAFEISRRLRMVLAEAMPDELGRTELSISVGLSHESGLIDPPEMVADAHGAMLDARHEGGARMLIAC
jgi:diguanylate cyclase (GGDEF)-like protein